MRKVFYNGLKKIFFLFQKFGINIIPNHYYSPIPDIRFLTDKIFSKKSNLTGLKIDDKKQLDLLGFFVSNYKNEFDKFPREKTKIPYQFYTNNGNFRSVDGEILYSMIRYLKPKKIIEIGAGYSTFCSAQGILKNKEENKNYECELIAIEPFPMDIFKKGFPGFSKLIHKKLQDIPISFFKKLEENDILFIDSSHVLKINSDVQYEYLELIPQLKKGVVIHIHDISLPIEYPREYYFDLFRFWNEQYILQAFLAFNDYFEILWMGKYIQIKHEDRLKEAFFSFKQDLEYLNKIYSISYKNKFIIPSNWPSSFWMRKNI